MTARSETEVLSWRRAAVRLGWSDTGASARRLRAMVRRREREGHRVLVQRGIEGGWGGVTMAALRQHLPELFRAGAREQDALAARLREYLAEVNDRIDEKATAAVTRLVEPRIDELHGRDAQLERRIDAVERRVSRVEAPAENGPRQTKTDHP